MGSESISNLFSLVVLIGFFGFCLAFFNVISLLRLYDRRKKEKREAEELKKQRMGKINIIADKMHNIFLHDDLLQERFQSFSNVRGWFPHLPLDLYNRFFDESEADLFLTQRQKFQNFFDQLLKIYAEKLKTAYDNEEKFKKEHKELKPNLMSGDEIRDFLKRKRFFSEEKKKAEGDNWDLHDALRDIGFDVWAEHSDGVGYKAYLYLKKSYQF